MHLIKLNASYKDFHNGMLRSQNNATTVKQRFQFSAVVGPNDKSSLQWISMDIASMDL